MGPVNRFGERFLGNAFARSVSAFGRPGIHKTVEHPRPRGRLMGAVMRRPIRANREAPTPIGPALPARSRNAPAIQPSRIQQGHEAANQRAECRAKVLQSTADSY
jgi:hypothetical protein